jgi:hypothetical protein
VADGPAPGDGSPPSEQPASRRPATTSHALQAATTAILAALGRVYAVNCSQNGGGGER